MTLALVLLALAAALVLRAGDDLLPLLEERPRDLRLRREIAEALAEEGRYAEALVHYLWVWDHGVRSEHRDIAPEIARLGRRHAPALAALEGRAVAARDRLRRAAEQKDELAAFSSARDFSALCEALGRSDDVVAHCDELATHGLLSPAVLLATVNEVFDALLSARRFGDAVAWMEDPLERFSRSARPSASHAELGEEFVRGERRWAVAEGAKILTALLGAGDDRADALEERILDFDASAATFAALYGAALDAGDLEEAAFLRERGLATLDAEGRRELERACERRARGEDATPADEDGDEGGEGEDPDDDEHERGDPEEREGD